MGDVALERRPAQHVASRLAQCADRVDHLDAAHAARIERRPDERFECRIVRACQPHRGGFRRQPIDDVHHVAHHGRALLDRCVFPVPSVVDEVRPVRCALLVQGLDCNAGFVQPFPIDPVGLASEPVDDPLAFGPGDQFLHVEIAIGGERRGDRRREGIAAGDDRVHRRLDQLRDGDSLHRVQVEMFHVVRDVCGITCHADDLCTRDGVRGTQRVPDVLGDFLLGPQTEGCIAVVEHEDHLHDAPGGRADHVGQDVVGHECTVAGVEDRDDQWRPLALRHFVGQRLGDRVREKSVQNPVKLRIEAIDACRLAGHAVDGAGDHRLPDRVDQLRFRRLSLGEA